MEWAFGTVRKGGPYALTSFQGDRRHYVVILCAQAMRAIKRIARVERARYTIQAEIGAIGHDLLGVGTGTAHRFVRLQAHGFDLVMEIGRILRTERLGVFRIEGKSVDPADFAFNAATEEPAAPARDQ